MGVPQAGLRSNALGSLGILIVVAGIAYGLPALDRALPRERPVAAGRPYRVTDSVVVGVPAGARLDVTGTRPGHTTGYVAFLVGGVRYVVLVGQDRLSVADAAGRLRTRLHDSLDASVATADTPLKASATSPSLGLAGRFTYRESGGWYAVRVFGPATVVDVTASGPPAELAARLPAIQDSVASIARSS